MNPFFGPGFIPPQAMNRFISPISLPKANIFKSAIFPSASRGLSLGKILKTTEQGINSFNQIIPIYQQVKPLFTNVKDFTKVFSKVFAKPQKKVVNANEKPITAPITKNETKKKTVNSININKFDEQNEPQHPFFL